MKIRCINGYGPQEKNTLERKCQFWSRLGNEVEDAMESEVGLIIQMDGNLWAGETLVKGDPNKMNNNGKLFLDFLKKYPFLTVINATQLCKGLITRRRITKVKTEEAILDFFVVCEKILPFVKEMVIDEDRIYPLSTFTKKGGVYESKNSDHFTSILDLNISFQRKSVTRKELFNIKNLDCQKEFKKLLDEGDSLNKCFENDESLDVQCKRWWKNLNHIFHQAFRKVRCNGKVKETEVSKLLKEKADLIQKIKSNKNEKEEEDLKNVQKKITDLIAEDNRSC